MEEFPTRCTSQILIVESAKSGDNLNLNYLLLTMSFNNKLASNGEGLKPADYLRFCVRELINKSPKLPNLHPLFLFFETHFVHLFEKAFDNDNNRAFGVSQKDSQINELIAQLKAKSEENDRLKLLIKLLYKRQTMITDTYTYKVGTRESTHTCDALFGGEFSVDEALVKVQVKRRLYKPDFEVLHEGVFTVTEWGTSWWRDKKHYFCKLVCPCGIGVWGVRASSGLTQVLKKGIGESIAPRAFNIRVNRIYRNPSNNNNWDVEGEILIKGQSPF